MAMKSYVIPCPSSFRHAVLELAERRKLTATEIALGVLSLLDPEDDRSDAKIPVSLRPVIATASASNPARAKDAP